MEVIHDAALSSRVDVHGGANSEIGLTEAAAAEVAKAARVAKAAPGEGGEGGEGGEAAAGAEDGVVLEGPVVPTAFTRELWPALMNILQTLDAAPKPVLVHCDK
jgi:hypothetical protein